ncbi:MAG: hypothetical protein JNM63_12465 [Spirochaetia bacterium]|nr:hypothetical protein [Spirochaetia bacterium]
MANEKVKDTGNDEEISLSDSEMENILGGAELSEVSLDLPSLDEHEEEAEEHTEEQPEEAPSGELNLDEEDITGDLPSLDDISLDEGPSDKTDDLMLDDQIPEDLPSIDEMDSAEEKASKKTLEEIDPPPLEETDFADDLPSLDELKIPELHEGEDEDTEIIDVSGDVPDELPRMPGRAASGASDQPVAQKASAANALMEDEDETVSLSETEMSGILSEVDENQVIDLKAPVDDGDEVVSVSGEELDSITQDLNLEESPETAEASVDLAEAAEHEDPTAKASGKDVMEDSVNFEAEIMESAQVSIAKPKKQSLVDLEEAVDKGIDAIDRMEAETPSKIQDELPDLSDENAAGEKPAAREMVVPSTKKKAAPREHTPTAVSDKELSELLAYLDELLEHLPEEKIREFAESKHYDRYISLINRLGI